MRLYVITKPQRDSDNKIPPEVTFESYPDSVVIVLQEPERRIRFSRDEWAVLIEKVGP